MKTKKGTPAQKAKTKGSKKKILKHKKSPLAHPSSSM